MSEPPPTGWTLSYSENRKRHYYYHHKTKTSLWNRPSLAEVALAKKKEVALAKKKEVALAKKKAVALAKEKAVALAEEKAVLAKEKEERDSYERELHKKRKVAPASKEDLCKVAPAVSAAVSPASNVETATEPYVVSPVSDVESATEPYGLMSRKLLVSYYQNLGRLGPKYHDPREAHEKLIKLVKSRMGDQGSLSQAEAIALDIVKHCAISESSDPRRKDNCHSTDEEIFQSCSKGGSSGGIIGQIIGGKIGGKTMGDRYTTAAMKLLANEPLSNEEDAAHQQCVDGGTTMGARFTTAAMKLLANEPLSNEEDVAHKACVDGGTTIGGMNRKAMFANGAVGVWLHCGNCRHGKKCGIYPEGHKNESYAPRAHGCPHCKKMCSFYTEEELEVRRKHKDETGRTKSMPFDYGLLNSL